MGMNIARYLSEDLIRLDFTAEQEAPPEENNSDKWRERNKERILAGLVEIIEQSGKTGNKSKLLTDFINRERKASTAIGHGIAVPHVRSMQAKDLIIAFARAQDGLAFGSIDGELTYMFFVMAAPPYDDNLYLKVFKALSENLQYETFRDELMTAERPFDVIRAFKSAE
jgi:PTS system fructose-specific IIC component